MYEMYPAGLAQTASQFAQYARRLDACLDRLAETAAALEQMSGQQQAAHCVRRCCACLPARAESLRRLGDTLEQITAEVRRTDSQICTRSLFILGAVPPWLTLPVRLHSTQLGGEPDQLGINFE